MSLADIPNITKALEGVTKRLRKVEVLSRAKQADTVNAFLELVDTPTEYAGRRDWAVAVNNDEDGLKFVPFAEGCVVHECDVIGWRAYGGTTVRTLIHESAFQLTADGNVRGNYAVDLQQVQYNDKCAEGLYSIILGGEENQIGPDGDYSLIGGTWNDIFEDSFSCWIIGESNWLEGTSGGSYSLNILGQAHTHEDCQYGLYAGYNNDGQEAFGCFALNEGNDYYPGASITDHPTYCGQMGINNAQTGDIYEAFQAGESNVVHGVGTLSSDSCWMVWQKGIYNYVGVAEGSMIWQFGRQCTSWLPQGTTQDFFSGRMMCNGDNVNEGSSQTPNNGGFNQNSWFNQNMKITTWPASWTTSRFEFPVLDDSIWGFRAEILGIEQGSANSYNWEIRGTVENDGGTTTILEFAVTNNYRDVATKEWQVVADDTNDRLVFEYRDTAGPDATPCNIQFSMHTIEVGYD